MHLYALFRHGGKYLCKKNSALVLCQFCFLLFMISVNMYYIHKVLT